MLLAAGEDKEQEENSLEEEEQFDEPRWEETEEESLVQEQMPIGRTGGVLPSNRYISIHFNP